MVWFLAGGLCLRWLSAGGLHLRFRQLITGFLQRADGGIQRGNVCMLSPLCKLSGRLLKASSSSFSLHVVFQLSELLRQCGQAFAALVVHTGSLRIP
jgi:hypothetical protein